MTHICHGLSIRHAIGIYMESYTRHYTLVHSFCLFGLLFSVVGEGLSGFKCTLVAAS